MCRFSTRLDTPWAFCGSFDHWQVDLKRCAVARLTVDPDVAATLFHDAIDRRKAEPRALPRFLGGKEGLKDAGLCLFVHSASRVADNNLDVASGFDDRAAVRIRLIQGQICRSN